MKVVDLGCGTGELTRQLADRLPESEVLGIDSSAEMLARAVAQRMLGQARQPRVACIFSGACLPGPQRQERCSSEHS